MVKLRDRVKAVTETTGTGVVDVSATPDGFQPFTGAYAEGETFPYAIHHVGEGEWEVGRGELNSAGELVRLEVQDSSAGGSKVDFSSGVKEVFVTATAEFLNNISSYVILNADTTAEVSKRYWLQESLVLSLPDLADVEIGDTVVVSKSIDADPTVVPTGSANIITEKGPTTSILFDINAEITFVFNGTDWEL